MGRSFQVVSFFVCFKKSFSFCKRINVFICLNQLAKSKLQTGLQLYYKKDADNAAVSQWIFQILTEHLFFIEHIQKTTSQTNSRLASKKQLPGGVLSKTCFRKFCKFHGEHLCRSLFFEKNCRPSFPESVEASENTLVLHAIKWDHFCVIISNSC